MRLRDRLRLWDEVFSAVRGVLRRSGALEVSTPVHVAAPALEPWIEPVAAAGGWLHTSPELAMKRLLAVADDPLPMFQVTHVFRAGEAGPRHRPEFHLLEWYRPGATLGGLRTEVEEVVAVIEDACARVLGQPPEVPLGGAWETRGWFDLAELAWGVKLRGDESGEALRAQFRHVSEAAVEALRVRGSDPPAEDEPTDALRTWTSLHGLLFEDAERVREVLASPTGLHVVDFPAPLAALARVDSGGRRAARFESLWRGLELANGYDELRDPAEQRHRFEVVGRLRAALGAPALPVDDAFLWDLPRMPASCGVALGLERVVMAATCAGDLSEVEPFLAASDGLGGFGACF